MHLHQVILSWHGTTRMNKHACSNHIHMWHMLGSVEASEQRAVRRGSRTSSTTWGRYSLHGWTLQRSNQRLHKGHAWDVINFQR